MENLCCNCKYWYSYAAGERGTRVKPAWNEKMEIVVYGEELDKSRVDIEFETAHDFFCALFEERREVSK